MDQAQRDQCVAGEIGQGAGLSASKGAVRNSLEPEQRVGYGRPYSSRPEWTLLSLLWRVPTSRRRRNAMITNAPMAPAFIVWC